MKINEKQKLKNDGKTNKEDRCEKYMHE